MTGRLNGTVQERSKLRIVPCSALYGACRRAAWALGYRRLVTYTLPSESGSSLRGAGWTCLGTAGGGSWGNVKRPRVDRHPLERKLRWEAIP